MSIIEPTVASIIGLPPPVALLVTVAFVFFLFRRDIREKANVTGALWLPVVWMSLIGSRSVVQWLNVLGVPIGARSMEEGNPLDAFVYFGLIASGVYVLNKRGVSLSEVIRNNQWLTIFIIYCFLAVLWSDFPFVAFKRWIKILGHPVMVLILFTEPDPEEALKRLIKRSAYVLVPFSILVIKFYPKIGRNFDEWSGLPTSMGVNVSKNGMGCVCMILGFFFFWQLLQTWRSPRGVARRNELLLIGAFLLMISYLFRKLHTATAVLSLLIGIVVMVVVGRRFVNRRLIGTYVIVGVLLLLVGELTFGLTGHIVELTQHGATLAGRAELWRELLAMKTNPLFGVGFESFWLGDRLHALWEARWWRPTEAHNGYLETYLTLGLVGLFLLAGVIIATFRKIRLDLLTNPEWGRVCLGFLATVILYNWTEATFRGLSVLWFAFYIIALDYPKLDSESAAESHELTGPRDELELAYSERRARAIGTNIS
jgi:exopolysaccharide production protein ExoQ